MVEVYVDPPKGLGCKDKIDKILLLLKSLYGLKQASKPFSDRLSADLVERGLKPLEHDPCLFMKEGMICVVYVDDTVITGPDSQTIIEAIRLLDITNDEIQHKISAKG